MTALLPHLLRRIDTDGPLSVADYMHTCLHHPQYGYYSTRDPLGAGGDFLTAPEVSQIFGELMGLALAQCWLAQGAPERTVLAELGPGRGTLMGDILRATARVPGFHDAVSLHLVEASPVLRRVQAETLKDHAPQFHDHAGSLPDGPLLVIANEFFDALPIRQFLRDGPAWRERMIARAGDGLGFALSEPVPLAALDARLGDTDTGDMVETCAAAPAIMGLLAERIARHGGAALIIDYGSTRSLGDTLQAVAAHRKCDPLETPGAADLTAHVAFDPLAEAARAAGCNVSRPTPQGQVLSALGAAERSAALGRDAPAETRERLARQLRRLTHGAEMGNLFKVLGCAPVGAALPPGVDT